MIALVRVAFVPQHDSFLYFHTAVLIPFFTNWTPPDDGLGGSELVGKPRSHMTHRAGKNVKPIQWPASASVHNHIQPQLCASGSLSGCIVSEEFL